jgi:ribose transport system substrate-binding protein
MKVVQPLRLITCLLVALVAVAGCGSDDEGESSASNASAPATKGEGAQESGQAGDITQYCGDQPMKVAYLKSVGGNSWVTQSAAEFKDEAAKCPNITEAGFKEAINDQQKAISDINSTVAEGVDVMVISADYGAPELPAIKKATQAGVNVVTVLGNAGGTPGEDFVESVVFDTEWIGQQWAEFLNEQLPDGGNVLYLGGTPGNETSTAFYAGISKALEKYPKIKWVTEDWVATDWDPAKKQRTVAAQLAKHGRIDAVVTDFNGTDTGIVPAYKDANFDPPIVTSITSNNAIGCQWREDPYPFMVMGQTSSLTRLGLRIGMAAANDMPNDEAPRLRPRPDVFEPGGKEAPCDEELPPDADLSADLTQEQLEELFSN